jgi:hypothetical protein
MGAAAGVAIWLTDVLLVAALSGSRGGAAAAAAVAATLLPVPAFVFGPPLARAVLAIAMLVCFLKALDLRRGPPIGGFARRLGHILAVFDTRRGRPRAPGVDRAALARLAVALIVTVCAIGAVRAAAGLSGASQLAARWLAVAVLLFAWFEALVALVRVGAALLGVEPPTLHDRPLESRSVGEFWARRWNRIVSSLLHDLCFRPAARQHPALGLVAAFAASAAIHGYAMGVALGVAGGLSWGAFFLVQPLLIGAERRAGVRHWPAPTQRLWTLAALALPSPLFLEPVARLFQ